MSRTALILIVVLLMILACPVWPYSAAWGFYPFSGLAGVFVVLLILALLGVI